MSSNILFGKLSRFLFIISKVVLLMRVFFFNFNFILIFYLVLGLVVGSTFAVNYCDPESLHCQPGKTHVACNNNDVSITNIYCVMLKLFICH